VNLDYAFQTDSLAIMVLGLATAGDLQKVRCLCVSVVSVCCSDQDCVWSLLTSVARSLIDARAFAAL
jgi:hypothetical protein